MIRSFQESDLNRLYLLIQKTIDHAYPESYSQAAVNFFKQYHSKERILSRYRKGIILVRESSNSILATGSLVGNEISGVFVSPYNQKKGYGREIMETLENIAFEKGLQEVILHVSIPAKPFYQKINYEILREEKLEVGDDEFLQYWSARKSLVIA